MKDAIAWAAGIVGLLTALYVGGYYALVVTPPPATPTGGLAFDIVTADAQYRFGGEATKTIFAPMHALDLRLRPKSWECIEYYPPRSIPIPCPPAFAPTTPAGRDEP